MKCLFLDIEMPIGEVCPVQFNKDGFICHEGCNCANNPELINEKVDNWGRLKTEMNLGVSNKEE